MQWHDKTQKRSLHCFAVRSHTAGVMAQLWALLLPLGFGGVAIAGQLQGLTADTMSPSQRVRAPPFAWSAQSSCSYYCDAAVIIDRCCCEQGEN